MRRRVLVTRAEPDASRTAKRLEALGYQPVILPLFETHPLATDLSAIPNGSPVVALTSANALRHLPRKIVAVLQDADCYCVGRKTAEAAREAGLAHVIEGGGDAEALAATIIRSVSNRQIVYLCGRVRRSGFEEMLAKAGFSVTAVEVYDTAPISLPQGKALASLGSLSLDAALVYSVSAADALSELSKSHGVSQLFEKTAFFCISERVAAVFEAQGISRNYSAAEPNEEALLSLLGNSGVPLS